jgi:hypothetical protein
MLSSTQVIITLANMANDTANCAKKTEFMKIKSNFGAKKC